MKNKYKVVALVPLEFSVEGSSDSKEAIESVKNIFEACRDDKDYADIVFDGIEESLRHNSIPDIWGSHCCGDKFESSTAAPRYGVILWLRRITTSLSTSASPTITLTLFRARSYP